MKFEDYFSTPERDKIIRHLAQSDLCPNRELLDGGCSLHTSCNECWEQAIINSDLAEYERKKPTPFYVVEHEGQHNHITTSFEHIKEAETYFNKNLSASPILYEVSPIEWIDRTGTKHETYN